MKTCLIIVLTVALTVLFYKNFFTDNNSKSKEVTTPTVAVDATQTARTPLRSAPLAPAEGSVQIPVLVDTSTCPIPAQKSQSIYTLPLWEILAKAHQTSPTDSEISRIPHGTSLAVKRKLMVKGPSFNNGMGIRGESYVVAIDNEGMLLGADEPKDRLPVVAVGKTILEWKIGEVLVYNKNKEETWANIWLIHPEKTYQQEVK